jgi:methanethiol S-methyltransferase
MPATRTVSRATVAWAWAGAALFALSLLYFAFSYGVRYGRPLPDGPVLRPVLANLLLFTMFAVHHSLLARTAAKAWLQRFLSPPVERSAYTWIASVLFVIVCASWRDVPGELYRLEGVAAVPGYLAQLLGVALTARAAAAIDVLDLAGVRPALDARDAREPRHVPLATTGLYGFVRHPLYFAWALLVFGAPHMTATRVTFAVISTIYLALAIPFEERSLIGLFGADYRAYQRQVRWRMLPGIY